MRRRVPPNPMRRAAHRAFTLTELLVVMGLIAVLALLTTIAVRGIARDARLSSAKNAVVAALDTARSQAMKHNAIVMVVFRPRLAGDGREMYVEAVTAKWTGDTVAGTLPDCGGGSMPCGVHVVDRFVPVQGIAPRRLPVGIKVAGPRYLESTVDASGTLVDRDEFWATQVHLPAIDPASPLGPPSEVPGAMIAVMYAPDGTTITANAQSDSSRSFVDFNDDGLQQDGLIGGAYDYSTSIPNCCYLEQRFEDDEPFLTFVPFLSVYDDDAARERRSTTWTNNAQGLADYEAELIGPNGFITRFADPIHFNRYTGVVMQ